MRIDDIGMALEKGDAGVAQKLAIDIVEPLNLLVFVCYQFCPIEAPRLSRPAVAREIVEVFAIMGSVNQQFLRNATDVDAGAAEITLFGYGDLGAERSRHPARPHAAGARTDGKQIVVIPSHRKNRPSLV